MPKVSTPTCVSVISIFALMIIIMAIGLVHSKRRIAKLSLCVDNLRNIELIKLDWASNENKTINDTPTWDDLHPYSLVRWSNNIPICPSGGIYTIGLVGKNPTCSIGGPEHSMAE